MSNTTIPLPVLAVVAFAATRFPVPSNPTPSTPPGDPRFDAHLDVVDRGDAGIVVTVPCDDAGCDFCAACNAMIGMLPPPAVDDLDALVASWQREALASMEATDGAMSLWRDALDADPALDQTLPWEHERAPMLPPAPQRRPPVRVSRGVVLPAPIGAEVA